MQTIGTVKETKESPLSRKSQALNHSLLVTVLTRREKVNKRSILYDFSGIQNITNKKVPRPQKDLRYMVGICLMISGAQLCLNRPK